MVVNTINVIEPRTTHGNKPLDTSMRDFLRPGNLNGKTHQSMGGVSTGDTDRRKIEGKTLHFPIHLLSCLLMTYWWVTAVLVTIILCWYQIKIFQLSSKNCTPVLHTSASPRTLQVFDITLGLIRHPASWAEQRLDSQALWHEDSTVILLTIDLYCVSNQVHSL